MIATKPTTNGQAPISSQSLVGGQIALTSPKRLARIAGVLYLLNGILGGFALLFVYGKVYVPGDAAKTAGNLIANSGLVRMGVVADLVQATIWVFLGLTLYRLLKHVSKSVASAMVVVIAIGAGIVMLNEVFGFEALRVATGAVNLAAFGTAGSNALALLLVDAHHYGILIAQVFFGLWLVPLGYLAYRSGWFPKTLGVALIVGAPVTSRTRSRRSWSPTLAKRFMATSRSRQPSGRSGRLATCS